jgi:4-hydroxy-tetrahydrodipicolinate synthase
MSVIRGIWAAVLTPIDSGLQPDPAKAVPYYRELLQQGCDGLNLLGTTGEAMSFSADQRLHFMESLAASGMPLDRTMVGTGAAALEDAVRLTRAATQWGFAAALIMPPFFFREATSAGIVAFYDALIAGADPPPRSVLLYNFPNMSGIGFDADLVDRLVERSRETIFGIKDSSNDPTLQTEIARRRPDFTILPGSESGLREALARGAAGCISGSVALWPQLAKRVFEGGDATLAGTLDRARSALDGVPLVGAMRYLTATLRADPDWERAMPPQAPLSAEQRRRLDAIVASRP